MAFELVAFARNSNGTCVVEFDVNVVGMVTSIRMSNGTLQPVRMFVDSMEGWSHSRNIGATDGSIYTQNIPTPKQFLFNSFNWSLTLNLDPR